MTGGEICRVHVATGEEPVSERARRGGFPANRIHEVKNGLSIPPPRSERHHDLG